jgi:hypothetical protein
LKGKEEELIEVIRSSNVAISIKELLMMYIEKERDVLENAEKSEIDFTQGSIKAYRKLLKKITEPYNGR